MNIQTDFNSEINVFNASGPKESTGVTNHSKRLKNKNYKGIIKLKHIELALMEKLVKN